MSALPPDDMRNLRQTAFAARHPVEAMIASWRTIGEQSMQLAALAHIHAGDHAAPPHAFIAALEDATDWQCELAWQGVEDIAAMLAAGMAALDVLVSRGIDPRVPALALWREVDAAQRGLLAMLDMAQDSETPSAATA